jgi:hypothetical protein
LSFENAEIGRERRDRKHPLKVVVSQTERASIRAKAENLGLSVSAYLRSVGLRYKPRPLADVEAIRNLLKVQADQGRLGGLLKLWLVEKPGQGASTFEVRRVLRQIEDLQIKLKTIVKRLG